tara:strand:+ start:182 stop:361 length:180 start_codon:yes stop_codon:yes gene_type:complete
MIRFLNNICVFKVFLKNFKEDKIILGRWNYTKNFKELEKKIYYANHDHCGPCGKIKQQK